MQNNIIITILSGVLIAILAWHYKQSFTLRDKEETEMHSELHDVQKEVNGLQSSLMLIQRDVSQTLEYQRMILDVIKNMEAIKSSVENVKSALENHKDRIETLEKYSIQYDKDLSEIKTHCSICKGKE